jgi:mono/diheme cytochrome c family protein
MVQFVTPLDISAHEPHECGPGFPDEPALSGHINHNDIISGKVTFDKIFEAGRERFIAVFNTCDGQGRPATTGTGEKRVPDESAFIRTSAPDSNACAGCHNQPRPGGGGDFVANVFVLAQELDPVTESVSSEFSNERNTLGMFGAGPIEMLAREMSLELQAIRDTAIREAKVKNTKVIKSLDTKGVNFGYLTAWPNGSVDFSGRAGVDLDLVIKPFHQAGVVVSLREFTVNAFNHHHGMQAEERFDLDPTKGRDFDEDGTPNELTVGDITAVTIFQAALATPGRLLPADPEAQAAVRRGELLFEQVSCATCHVPAMKLTSRFFTEPSPFNPTGTFKETGRSFSFDLTQTGDNPRLERDGEGAIVRAYTDLKRHDLCDGPDHPDPIRYYCNEHLAQKRPDQDDKPGSEFFLTRKLWDVGNSAPYGHRGDLTTITEAILVHGGEARASRDAFVARSVEEQAAIIKFLKTLQVLPPGSDPVIIEGSGSGSTSASVQRRGQAETGK